jgi:hypothetical protein
MVDSDKELIDYLKDKQKEFNKKVEKLAPLYGDREVDEYDRAFGYLCALEDIEKFYNKIKK